MGKFNWAIVIGMIAISSLAVYSSCTAIEKCDKARGVLVTGAGGIPVCVEEGKH